MNDMKGKDLEFTIGRKDFPKGFVFGTSTSAYQIEGRDYGGAGMSHWDDFAATPGNVVNAEDGATACNHYNLYEDDLDLIKQANLDSYHFSISWPRVMPEGRGRVNEEGLDFYERLLDAMLERNIKPLGCFHHWELPSALADLGGWRNHDIGDWFTDYVEVVYKRLGDRMQEMATFNEPWCIAWLSHFLGHHAPGIRDIRAASRAMHNVLHAHGRAVQALRSMGADKLGIILNFEYTQPANDSQEAKKAAEIYDGIYNRWFLGALFKKQYPADVLEHLEKYLPKGYEKDFDHIGEPLDWLGVNYYTRKLIDADPTEPFPSLKEVEGPLAKTTMGWEIYPDGLYKLLTWMTKEYSLGLPMYITENGISLDDKVEDGVVYDPIRAEYLSNHFTAAKKAMDDGVPLAGYFVWSMLDNFEWALGYEKRFGLIHVDHSTFKRTPKQSYYALREAMK